MDNERPCTCHPGDELPDRCARRYALKECRLAGAIKEVLSSELRFQNPDALIGDYFVRLSGGVTPQSRGCVLELGPFVDRLLPLFCGPDQSAADALLREGAEEAWCDAALGCNLAIESRRAARFRDAFYGWRKRVAAHFGETWPPDQSADAVGDAAQVVQQPRAEP